MKKFILAALLALLVLPAPTAFANGISFAYLQNDRPHANKVVKKKVAHRQGQQRHVRRSQPVPQQVVHAGSHNAGPRPGRWCGWYMRTRHGGGAEYNLARNWAKRGVSAGGPQVGAIVVWRHHVGEIVGRNANGQWLVLSGNTGIGKGRARGVSTKARSLAGAIAFRML